MATGVRGVSLIAVMACLACSSSSNGGSGGSGGNGASAGSGAFGGFGATAGSAGSAGTPQDGGLGGSAGSAGSAGTAGAGGTVPLPVDVKDSAACSSWCAKLDAACGTTKCVPEEDCKIKAGQCATSMEAYLQCQASTGSFSCGSSGHSIIHNCDYDSSVCAPGTIVGASCDGNCGGKAPSGCYCDPTCKQYNDCCDDFDAKCSGSGGSGGGSGGGTGPYDAPKTCAQANNGKGCCGWGSSPYDQIAYSCVGGQVAAQNCGPIGCVLDTAGNAKCGDGSEYPAVPNCFQ